MRDFRQDGCNTEADPEPGKQAPRDTAPEPQPDRSDGQSPADHLSLQLGALLRSGRNPWSDPPVDVRGIAAGLARNFREHPESWRAPDLATAEPIDPSAAAHPLLHHIILRTANHRASSLVLSAFWPLIPRECPPLISAWEAQAGRTVADVIALCERVAAGSHS